MRIINQREVIRKSNKEGTGNAGGRRYGFRRRDVLIKEI